MSKRKSDTELASPEKKAKTDNDLSIFLSKTTLGDVLREQHKDGGHVITLDNIDTVSDALKKLAKHKYLSAPVMYSPLEAHEEEVGDYEEGGSHHRPTYMGFFSVSDALRYFVDDAKSAESEKWASRTVYAVSGRDVDLVFQLNTNVSLRDAIFSGFFQGNGGESKPHVHRLAGFDTAGRITFILSQSDVVRFLAHHRSQLGSLCKKTVQELGLAQHQVVCVEKTASVLDAFSTLNEKKVSSVGIIDHGKLVANLSASDLRGITADDFKHLKQPVYDWLCDQMRKRGFTITEESKKHASALPVLEVKPETKLDEVLDKLQLSGVHRLYITDDHHKPVSLVTLTDILRVVLDCSKGGNSSSSSSAASDKDKSDESSAMTDDKSSSTSAAVSPPSKSKSKSPKKKATGKAKK